ncbi:uncharacterized protein LOC101863272 [Aplysia californica]|uniref:Uncharacterized protein LOC101863272 n=1 Tax=Aplysia californica TaxID=6500 RepID=A0ABM0JRR4_APLCA|nr:uncharacterized protein LOC101863272 [Aplysia californica]
MKVDVLALLLFNLLASGLPSIAAQNLNSPVQPAKTGIERLEEKIDRLGNELAKIGLNIDRLLEKSYDPEYAPKPIWPPLKLERASRESLDKGGSKFTVWFSTTNPMVAATPHWKLKPVGKTAADTLPSTLNRFNKIDESTDFVTTVEVKEAGQLTLDLIEKDYRFELLLLFDNSESTSKQSRYQKDIPLHNFAVDAEDVISYKEGEAVVLKITAANGDGDKYQIQEGLDIQYLSPDKKVGYYSWRPEEVNDIVCRAKVTKKYFSHFDMDLTINTARVRPIGYTRVHSTFRDSSKLVQGVRLVRVLSIRPSDQANAYPNNFLDIVAIGGECSYSEMKCPAQCVVYGNSINAQSIRIDRLNDDDKKTRIASEGLTHQTVLGYASATAYIDIPTDNRKPQSDRFVCSVNPKGQKKVEDEGVLKYRVKTSIVKDKSFYEINESQVKITCSAMGDPRPQTMASLSMKPEGSMTSIELNYQDYNSLQVGPTEVASVFTYRHSFGRIDLDRVRATCYARGDMDDPTDKDEYVLTQNYYLTKDRD